jgi:tetratricopeptide (TPR) repeat protein
MKRWTPLFILAACLAPVAAQAANLKVTPVDREPPEGRRKLSEEEITKLREAVAAEPRERPRRFALVQALVASGRLAEALVEAKAWRQVDAYNLVVVRWIGDIQAQLGDLKAARRTYSAVVELLPEDAQAHRALATVLKQSGDVASAYDRLVVAARLAPGDLRIAFELADAAHRLNREQEAEERFQKIIADPQANPAITYPAKQRLAQIWAKRGGAWKDKIATLGVAGGADNDIKVYLTWDTDRSDVDLWVTNPRGRKIYYEKKQGDPGEALFDDVTTGYGPESFTAQKAQKGVYLVQVNLYASNRAGMNEARGEVLVVLNEGRPDEQRVVLPYRLFVDKQTVTVAKIEVQ